MIVHTNHPRPLPRGCPPLASSTAATSCTIRPPAAVRIPPPCRRRYRLVIVCALLLFHAVTPFVPLSSQARPLSSVSFGAAMDRNGRDEYRLRRLSFTSDTRRVLNNEQRTRRAAVLFSVRPQLIEGGSGRTDGTTDTDGQSLQLQSQS